MLAHLSARSLGARLAPEGLSLPDRLPEPEALLRPFSWEELGELGPLSCSSQPPPACPGWCLMAGRNGGREGDPGASDWPHTPLPETPRRDLGGTRGGAGSQGVDRAAAWAPAPETAGRGARGRAGRPGQSGCCRTQGSGWRRHGHACWDPGQGEAVAPGTAPEALELGETLVLSDTGPLPPHSAGL